MKCDTKSSNDSNLSRTRIPIVSCYYGSQDGAESKRLDLSTLEASYYLSNSGENQRYNLTHHLLHHVIQCVPEFLLNAMVPSALGG